jgi:hypothetical protein
MHRPRSARPVPLTASPATPPSSASPAVPLRTQSPRLQYVQVRPQLNYFENGSTVCVPQAALSARPHLLPQLLPRLLLPAYHLCDSPNLALSLLWQAHLLHLPVLPYDCEGCSDKSPAPPAISRSATENSTCTALPASRPPTAPSAATATTSAARTPAWRSASTSCCTTPAAADVLDLPLRMPHLRHLRRVPLLQRLRVP